MTPVARLLLLACVPPVVACSSDPTRSSTAPEVRRLTEAELLDPASCETCHPGHVSQWFASMHAYSSRDPVFLAMNRRGQEETGGELGDFCVQCHAPVALALGLTEDGLDLPDLPDSVQGVTCYFCHSVATLSRDHNNGLVLATDHVLRGAIDRPVEGAAHRSAYSPLHDGRRPESSELCGSCHDVTLPNGVELERTSKEWRGSAFAPEHARSPDGVIPCSGCHMAEEATPTATGAGTSRRAHDHRFVGVDVALTPFPTTAAPEADERLALEQGQLVGALLDTSLGVEICVQPMVGFQSAIQVTLENASAGHAFPSGASQDRRVWLEVTAFDAAGMVLYTSGAVAPDEGGDADPDLWALHDRAFGADDRPAHMFWEIARVEKGAVPAPATFDPSSPDALLHHVTRRFPRSRTEAIEGVVARVVVTAKVRPIGLDVLGDLVQSGHLDGDIVGRMPLFDLVPNRHLAGDPTLASLAQVTFEWSEAVRESGRFATRTLNDGAYPMHCVATTARR